MSCLLPEWTEAVVVGRGGEEEVGEGFDGKFEDAVAGGEWRGREEKGARKDWVSGPRKLKVGGGWS